MDKCLADKYLPTLDELEREIAAPCACGYQFKPESDDCIRLVPEGDEQVTVFSQIQRVCPACGDVLIVEPVEEGTWN